MRKFLFLVQSCFSVVEVFRSSLCVGYMYTGIYHTSLFQEVVLYSSCDSLYFCVSVTFMCLDVWHLLFFITHFIPLQPEMMSDMTSIIFFNWNLVCGGQCVQLDYSCAPEITMHLPVDTWSDVVCDSQVKCLIWTCCSAWVSCPVSEVLNYSCI